MNSVGIEGSPTCSTCSLSESPGLPASPGLSESLGLPDVARFGVAQTRTLRAGAALGVLGALATVVGARLAADPQGDSQGALADPSTAQSTAAVAGSEDVGDVIIEDQPSTLTANQRAGLAFLEVAQQAGLSAPHSSSSNQADMAMTSGAAVADIDRDGWFDVLLTRVGLPNALYLNQKDGTFVDVTAESGLDQRPLMAIPGNASSPVRELVGGSGAAAFADVDADGCLDVFIAGVGAGDNALMMNDCAGGFVDETAARGLSLPPTASKLGAQGHGVTFGDVNHDGALDLLVLDWDTAFLNSTVAEQVVEEIPRPGSNCERTKAIRKRLAGLPNEQWRAAEEPNRSALFMNTGDGHFVNATNEMGLDLGTRATFTGDFVDMDADGWEDLVLAGDFCTSTIYRNLAGERFEAVHPSSGIGTDENGMGSVVADVDRDGDPDWFVTGVSMPTEGETCSPRRSNIGCSGNRLYLNEGGMRFRDATDRWGIRHGWWGWGAAIQDFGNNGSLGIMMTNGFNGYEPPLDRFGTDPMRFWVPRGLDASDTDSGLLVDGAERTGLLSNANGHGLVPFDYDNDGDLDVLIANYGEPPSLYRNERPTDRHWLTVRLEDSTQPGNPEGIGAKVVVTPQDGPSPSVDTGATDGKDHSASAGVLGPVTSWIATGGSYESQRPAEVHVGLIGGEPVAAVKVWWPGEPLPQIVTDVAPNQVLTIRR